MSIAWSDVTAIAAELSTVPTGTQNYFIAHVDKQIDDIEWGDMADDGRRWLAAHLGAVYNQSAGAAGPVVSESLGPMSVSYAASDSGSIDDELGTTKYGRYYLHMMRLLRGNLGFVP
jgi:hypothetical protein